jgi:hypothetical protein
MAFADGGNTPPFEIVANLEDQTKIGNMRLSMKLKRKNDANRHPFRYANHERYQRQYIN